MLLSEKIPVDLREAMKAGDKARLSTLRLLLAQLNNEKLSLKKDELSDEESQKVIQREVKKRREAAESYLSAGRANQAQAEEAEQKILQAYLPLQFSDEELQKIIEDEMSKFSEAGPINEGKLMGAVMGKVRGKADGNKVKEIVKKKLS